MKLESAPKRESQEGLEKEAAPPDRWWQGAWGTLVSLSGVTKRSQHAVAKMLRFYAEA